jgi:hypothetical protein
MHNILSLTSKIVWQLSEKYSQVHLRAMQLKSRNILMFRNIDIWIFAKMSNLPLYIIH